MSDLPLAFDVERVRRAMLEGIIVPRELVNESFKVLSEQVHATRTHYFQKNGRVTDKRDIADNSARLTAVDMVFSMAGLFKPDDRRGSGGLTPGVAIEVSKDGVIRIAVGSAPPALSSPELAGELTLPQVVEPTAIPSFPERQRVVQDVDAIVNKFNTILDEIVDE